MTRPRCRPALAFAFALLLACSLAASPARALVDYTDTWWAAGGAEPGWGVNFTQQNRFLYGTFYVYGPDGKAVWYTAQMNRVEETEIYTGPVYRISGTWFGAPVWAGYDINQVGTASFAASAAHRGVLTWNVEGTAMTKTIERLEAVPVPVEGVYIGGVSGGYSDRLATTCSRRSRSRSLITRSASNVIKIEFFNLAGQYASARWRARRGSTAGCGTSPARPTCARTEPSPTSKSPSCRSSTTASNSAGA